MKHKKSKRLKAMKAKASKLKILRVMCGKSQADLARETGLTQPYISMIETNKAIPTIELREKIAAAVGVEDSEQLFKEK